jgi:hypothetical protein
MSFCSRIGSLGTRAYHAVESQVLTCPYGVGRAAQNLKAAVKTIPTAIREIAAGDLGKWVAINALFGALRGSNTAVAVTIGTSLVTTPAVGLLTATGSIAGMAIAARRSHSSFRILEGMGIITAISGAAMGASVLPAVALGAAAAIGVRKVVCIINRIPSSAEKHMDSKTEIVKTSLMAGAVIAGGAALGPLGALGAGAIAGAAAETVHVFCFIDFRLNLPETTTRFPREFETIKRAGTRALLADHGMISGARAPGPATHIMEYLG